MIDIRAARQKLELNQTELAEKLGLDQSTISRFEGGKLDVDERTALAIEALLMRKAAQPTAPAEQNEAPARAATA